MPQNKNPIQQRIEEERLKNPANELTQQEIAQRVGQLARAEGVRANRDKISQGVKQAFADPEIRERHLRAIQEFAATPAHKEKNRRAQETREANGSIDKLVAGTRALRSDPIRSADLNRKSKLGVERAKETPEYWANYYAGIAIRDADPEYHKRRLSESKKRVRQPVSTDLGVFETQTDAMIAHGFANTEKVRHRCKSPNFPDWQFITVEEYELLKK